MVPSRKSLTCPTPRPGHLTEGETEAQEGEGKKASKVSKPVKDRLRPGKGPGHGRQEWQVLAYKGPTCSDGTTSNCSPVMGTARRIKIGRRRARALGSPQGRGDGQPSSLNDSLRTRLPALGGRDGSGRE